MIGSAVRLALFVAALILPLSGRAELASVDVRVGPVTMEAPRQMGKLKVNEVTTKVEYLDPEEMSFGEFSMKVIEVRIDFDSGGSIQIEVRPSKSCGSGSQTEVAAHAVDVMACIESEWSGMLRVHLRARLGASCWKDGLNYLEGLQLNLDGDDGKVVPIELSWDEA